ncbi:hypothetical protein [Faucicola boevrei]|uniref:hypothetical protein n=1 Tax=Faucicola boevrei TaxID=346665 RepID=UPI0003689455|nr:hypothetical protein [Moraxella boevrei]
MKKLLALSISSILLTACGGGSDGGATKSTPTPTTPSIQTPTTKLQTNNPSIGQKLVFGNGALKADNIAGKKYYARYAYCPTHCSVGVNVGEMNFSLEKDGDTFKVSQNSVSVDKFGNIHFFKNGQGGVQWTQKRVKYIEKLINALEKGDSQEAITNMALLANSLYGTDLQNINLLPADIDEYLVHIGVDSNARLAIKDYIQENLHHIREL